MLDLDYDFTFGFSLPGNYKYLLETTNIIKKGLPYRSNCTKNLTIEDKNHSKYSYPACMDKCMSKRMHEQCGTVLRVAEDYFAKVPQRVAKGLNKTV